MNSRFEPELESVPETVAPSRGPQNKSHPFANWQEHHRWSALASLRRLLAKPFGTLLTVTVMALALALPLAFYLLLANVQQLGDALGQQQSVSVFMKPGQPASAAQLLAKDLKSRIDVTGVTLKTPQQGMDELAKMQGFSGALHALDDNPLPFVLQVQPANNLDATAVDQLVVALRGMPGVDLVQDSGSWRQRLDAMLGLGNRLVLVLGTMLAAAALLVVCNTVRLDIVGRTEEIDVLLLVGASRSFVRRPYLYAGLWYGLLGGILAALLAVLIEAALAQPVQALMQVYDGKLLLGGLPTWLLLAVPVAAAMLGWLGARLVSAWHLRRAY